MHPNKFEFFLSVILTSLVVMVVLFPAKSVLAYTVPLWTSWISLNLFHSTQRLLELQKWSFYCLCKFVTRVTMLNLTIGLRWCYCQENHPSFDLWYLRWTHDSGTVQHDRWEDGWWVITSLTRACRSSKATHLLNHHFFLTMRLFT